MEKLDDQFREPVGRSRLAGEEKCPWRHLERGVLAQPVVKHDDPQRIQQLTLVFVDTLDLAIEHRVWIHRDAEYRSEPVSTSRFGLALGASEEVAKTLILGEQSEP